VAVQLNHSQKKS